MTSPAATISREREERFWIRRAIVCTPHVFYELEPEFGKPTENNVIDAEPWLLIIDGFKQAWDVRAEEFTEMSAKYNVDIRIFAWEQGMQFERHVEILKGKLVADRAVHYDDWDWDCPMPWIGG